MINFSFLSKASWCSLRGQQANQNRARRRHEANLTRWLVGAGTEDSPCRFIDDPVRRVKATGPRWQRAETHTYWTLLHLSVSHTLPERATRTCMAPSPRSAMNPAQGSPSQDATQLHPKEETDTEGEEPQPKDMTTEKGYKQQRSSLPFSVESLISKKPTCRTSYPASDLALVLPKPAAGQFSPRTFYAESKVAAESSQGVSSSSSEDSPQFCEKEQSTWYQPSSFSTPPRKSVPPLMPEFTELPNKGARRSSVMFTVSNRGCERIDMFSCCIITKL